MKVMFCLFAQNIGELPAQLFTKIIDRCLFGPENFQPLVADLFNKMKTGGWYGNDKIEYFNGGLFDDAPPLPLNSKDLNILRKVAEKPWAGVEPTIFGTLFERILDPEKRAQIGAHYTSKEDILLVVEPVVMTPLRREWEALKQKLQPALDKHDAEKDRKKRDILSAPIKLAVEAFRQRLSKIRVLDPACGSANFLYVTLQRLLDLEDEAVRFCALHDIYVDAVPRIRPTQMHGIEINKYAAELAQVVIWIGYLQWLHDHNIDDPRRPILSKLQCIENRDAILDFSSPSPSPGTPGEGRGEGASSKSKSRKQGRDALVTKKAVPASWPEADFIIGNPPFLGNKLFRKQGMPAAYIDALYSSYDLNRNADLCCYWFELGRRAIEANQKTRCGLLATQGIRGGDNRIVLERIKKAGDIFMAWADRDWILDGAAVHVSMIGFDDGSESIRFLDGQQATSINADLSSAADITRTKQLAQNSAIGFVGACKKGKFEIGVGETVEILNRGGNPNGKPNRDVLKPWYNGIDVVRRYKGDWIIDFGINEDFESASRYELPMDLARKRVKPERDRVRNESEKRKWWMLARPAPDMRAATEHLERFVVVPQVAKHRVFTWLQHPILPSHQLTVLARDDDYFFGVVQSAPHVLWSLKLGTQLEDRPRYTPTTCFETFALPWSPGKEPSPQPSPGVPGEGVMAWERISDAARELNELRERWLNPPEWIELIARQIDEKDKFEDVPKDARPLIRQSAIMAAAAKDSRLKKRTLTNLYNERPAWLKLAHEKLDRAVLAAYAATDPEGKWSEDFAEVWIETGAGQPLPTDHPLAGRRAEVDRLVLENLLRLNHARAGS